MANHRIGLAAVLAGGICLAAGCEASSEDGEGTLRVTIYGEEFIEDSIPADDVVDGWTIDFSKFLVAVDSVDAGGEPLTGSFVFDLTLPSGRAGHEVGTLTVPAGIVEHLGYRIGPTTSATAGNAAAPDVDLMTSMGYGMFVEGTATRGGDSVAFAWGFDTDTRYVACETEQAVADGGEATSQITVHADHLFYDDLDLPEPNVAFDLVASGDTSMDSVVTPDELQGVDITGEANYGVGSRDITDLWGFISQQTTTVGHIDGEGHCEQG
jgi:hypothetical protein